MDRRLADIAIELGIPAQRLRDYYREQISDALHSRLLHDAKGRLFAMQNPRATPAIGRNGWQDYVPQKDQPPAVAERRRAGWRAAKARARQREQEKGLTIGSQSDRVVPHLTGGTALSEQAADDNGASTTSSF